MALVFLLDEHLSPKVAEITKSLGANFDVKSVLKCEQGDLKGESDEFILNYCIEKSFVLVTFDVNTIPQILKSWFDIGKNHAGIVFVSTKTLRSSDSVSIAKGLIRIGNEKSNKILKDSEWQNQIIFLQ